MGGSICVNKHVYSYAKPYIRCFSQKVGVKRRYMESKEFNEGNFNKSDSANSSGESSEMNRLIEKLLSEDPVVREDVAKLYTYDEKKVWKAIQHVADRKVKRIWLRKAIGVGAAACVFFAVLSVLVFKQLPQLNNNAIPFENQLTSIIEPGVKKATLEMSDGTKVEIDDLEREVFEHDNTKILTVNGQTRLVASNDNSKFSSPLYNTITVPRGAEYSVVLEDGTSVYLNSESSITYPTRFVGENRKISITGEVFMDVAHNPNQPFIVEVQDQIIRVLGTSFNISAYDDDKFLTTTVVSGVVLLECDGRQTTIPAGMQAAKLKGSDSVSLKAVDAESFSAWIKGDFVFFDERIEDICKKLSRWYNVKFDISSASLKNIKYSGVIKRYKTFNDIAELIQTTQEFIFREKNGVIQVVHYEPDLMTQ